MSIYTRKGEKVVYANVNAGMESDKKMAKPLLELGKIYTVKRASVYRSISRVHLLEVVRSL